AQVKVRRLEIRLETDGLPVFGHGLSRLALTLQGLSEGAVRLGVVRLKADRLPEGGGRLGRRPLAVGPPAVVVVGGLLRLETDGLAESGQYLTPPALSELVAHVVKL